MRSKRIIFILIILTLSILGTNSIAAKTKIERVSLYDSYIEYKLSKEYNNESYVKKQEQYKEEIEKLNKKLIDLNENTEKLKKEQEEIMRNDIENNIETNYERITVDNLYGLLVKSAKDTGTDVEKFYTFNEPDIYTVQVKGLFRDLNNTINDFKKSVENNDISIGNMSIRQDYDAYNLERDFDGKSMLEWYDSKIVNAMGDVIELSDLILENKNNKDKDVDYTLMTLDDVKLDTESINREVTASNKRIDEEIAELLIEYGKQKDIIIKSGYDEEVKDELMDRIIQQHEDEKLSLINSKETRKKEIEDKYQKIYEKDKAKVADAILKYNKKLVELKATLADSSQLVYTMTFTIRAR